MAAISSKGAGTACKVAGTFRFTLRSPSVCSISFYTVCRNCIAAARFGSRRHGTDVAAAERIYATLSVVLFRENPAVEDGKTLAQTPVLVLPSWRVPLERQIMRRISRASRNGSFYQSSSDANFTRFDAVFIGQPSGRGLEVGFSSDILRQQCSVPSTQQNNLPT